MPRLPPFAVLLSLAALIVLAWYVPNRPTAGEVKMPADKLNSVSFAPYRAGESPLTGRFATAAEVDQDLALIARRARAIRTYSSLEGNYDLAKMARAHGLKIWQGIWLGSDRASNAREIAAGIKAANAYPDVIDRVVVGNEVLLRRDLPPEELIAAIDQVRRAVRQKVTYADVWNFFLDYPQVVAHLDVLSIHILPYWEDQPTNIAGTIAHEADVVARMHARFPAIPLVIGETGWPSRGRWRQDAAPSLVNEVIFLRRFVALAQADHLDYNFFASFDQDWKYQNEGVVGASWGLWTVGRAPKFPWAGPVQENAAWPAPAALCILCGFVLYAQSSIAKVLTGRQRLILAVAAMLLGGAMGFAWAGTAPVLFDRFALIAGIANLAGQAVLAVLFMHRLGRPDHTTWRTGRDATQAARALLTLRRPLGWRGADWHGAVFEDLAFVFVWTAAVLQLLLLYDPRYRDFPLPTFAVPVVVTLMRAVSGDLPRSGGGREEWVAGGTLLIAALAGAVQEGALNLQSLGWSGCAVVLAGPTLLRVLPSASPSHGSGQGVQGRAPDPGVGVTGSVRGAASACQEGDTTSLLAKG